MGDPIKELFEATKSSKIYLDENDLRTWVQKNPKEVFQSFQGTKLFLDYEDFENSLGLKKNSNSNSSALQSPSLADNTPVVTKKSVIHDPGKVSGYRWTHNTKAEVLPDGNIKTIQTIDPNEQQPDPTGYLEDKKKFESNIIKFNGKSIFPEQDKKGKWFFEDGGVRNDLPDDFTIKPGQMVKIPNPAYYFNTQIKGKPEYSKYDFGGSFPSYLKYNGKEWVPVTKGEEPQKVSKQTLPTAVVTPKKKDIQEGGKVAGPTELGLNGFAEELFYLSAEDGGAPYFSQFIKDNPGIGSIINKRVAELGKDYKTIGEVNPVEAKRIILESLYSLYTDKYEGLTEDLNILNQGESVISDYNKKQDDLKARLGFVAKRVLGGDLYKKYQSFQTLGKELESSKMDDAISYYKLITKYNAGYGLSKEESDRYNELTKIFGENSNAGSVALKKIQEYNALYAELKPHLQKIDSETGKISSEFDNNNNQFTGFREKYNQSLNRIKEAQKKNDQLNYSIAYIDKLFPKYEGAEYKQDLFNKRIFEGNQSIGDTFKSLAGGALKSLLNTTQSILDLTNTFSGYQIASLMTGEENAGKKVVGQAAEGAKMSVSRNLPQLTDEMRQWADKTNQTIQGQASQDVTKVFGDMTPTIIASVLTGGGSGAQSAITFLGTYANVLQQSKEKARELRLTGLSYDLYSHGTAAIESLTETLNPVEKLYNRAFTQGIMDDFRKGLITKSNISEYVLNAVGNYIKNTGENFAFEQIENDMSNGLTPVLNYLVNKNEGRDVLSTEFEFFDPNEIKTTLAVTAIMGAGPSMYKVGEALSLKPALLLYEQYPSLVNQSIQSLSESMPEQYAMFSEAIAEYQAYEQRMPEGLTPDQKVMAFELSKQIDDTKSKITPGISPLFSEALNKKIDALQKQLNEIIADPIKAQEATAPDKQAFEEDIDKNIPTPESIVDDVVTVGDVIGKRVTYKGKSGTIYQDGQALVIEMDNAQEYEIGNINEISPKNISELGIEVEEDLVKVNESGSLSVRGNEYVFDKENPTSAINYNNNGERVSVTLRNKDGKARTFRGQMADELAYQLTLQEISKNNGKEFEQFVEASEPVKESIILRENESAAKEGTNEGNAGLSDVQVSPTRATPEVAEQPKVDAKPNARVSKPVVTEERPLKGRTIVTRSGLTEKERQKMISQRAKSTKVSDKDKRKNALIDGVKEYNKMGRRKTSSEGLQKLNDLRAEARNLGLNLEKSRNNDLILKTKKGGKVSGNYKDIGDDAIVPDGRLLTEMDQSVRDAFDDLLDKGSLPNGMTFDGLNMSPAQQDKAIQDILDGIPSQRADNYLKDFEKMVSENSFRVYDKTFGEQYVPLQELLGAEREVIGQPMTEDDIDTWNNEESELTPEQRAAFDEEFENLIDEYEQGEEEGVDEKVQESEQKEPARNTETPRQDIRVQESPERVTPSKSSRVNKLISQLESTKKGVDAVVEFANQLADKFKKFTNVTVVADNYDYHIERLFNEGKLNEFQYKVAQKAKGFFDPNSDTIYLNPARVTSETAVHEFGHVWFGLIKKYNPELYKKGMDLAGEVKLSDAYANLDNEEAREEFLVRMIGKLGAEAYETNSKLNNWLKEVINYIKEILGIDADLSNMTLDDFVKIATADILSGGEVTGIANAANVDKVGAKGKTRFSVDEFEDLINEFSFSYMKDSDEFQKLKDDGYITEDKTLEDFVGYSVVLHVPDNAFTGEIRKGGELLVEGKGGLFYPIRFHKEGYFWASTASMAERTASLLNSIRAKSPDGKIRFVLVSAPVDKVMSSTLTSNGMIDIITSKAFDERAEIKEKQVVKSIMDGIRALKLLAKPDQNGKTKIKYDTSFSAKSGETIMDAYKRFVNSLPKITETTSLKDVKNMMRDWYSPDVSTFDSRKNLNMRILEGIANNVKSKKARRQILKFLGQGTNNPVLKNTNLGKISMANLFEGFSNLLSEPLLKGQPSGKAYAVLELDSDVESFKTSEHESYPYAIRSKNPEIKTVLHVLQDRKNWFDYTIDPATGENIRPDRFSNVLPPSAGVSPVVTLGVPKESNVESNTIKFQADERISDFIKSNIDNYTKDEIAEALMFSEGMTEEEAYSAIDEAVGEKQVVKEDTKNDNQEFEREPGKRSLLNRAYEGKTNDEVKAALEKFGLDRDIESHEEAERNAEDFVANFGYEQSAQMVRDGEIGGAAASFIWAKAIDAVGEEYNQESDPGRRKALADKQASLLNEFDNMVAEAGRQISALQTIYKMSPLGYRFYIEKKVSSLNKNVTKKEKKKLSKIEKASRNAKDEVADLIIENNELRDKLKNIESNKKKNTKAELKTKAKLKIDAFFNKSSNIRLMADQQNADVVDTLLADPDISDYIKAAYDEASDFDSFKKELTSANPKLGKLSESIYKKLGGEVKVSYDPKTRLVNALRNKITKLSKAQQDAAIAALSKVQRGLWGEYKDNAVGRLMGRIKSNLFKKDIEENPALKMFVDGLVKNFNSMQPTPEGQSSNRSTPMEIFADAIKNPEKYAEVLEEAKAELMAANADNPQVLLELDRYFGEFFREPFSTALLDKAVLDGLKEIVSGDLPQQLTSLAREYYKESDKLGQDLITYFVSKTGLTEAELQPYVSAIEEAYDRLLNKRILSEIERVYPLNAVTKRKGKKEYQRIVEAINLGLKTGLRKDGSAFVFEKEFYSKFGLIDTSEPDVRQKIDEFADKIYQNRQNPLYHSLAMVEMLDWMANRQKENRVIAGMTEQMYANMLFGQDTHIRNTVFNSQKVFGALASMMLQSKVSGLSAFKIFKSFLSGFDRGIQEMVSIAKTGYERSGNDPQARRFAERSKDLNKFMSFWSSYVNKPGRLLSAMDSLINFPLRNARLRYILQDEMRKAHPDLSKREINDAVDRVLEGSDAQQAEWKRKAEEDTIRFYGLQEPLFIDGQKNPAYSSGEFKNMYRNYYRSYYNYQEANVQDESVFDEAKDYADTQLLISRPKGWFGAGAVMLNNLGHMSPLLKVLTTPFVNVPFNVAAHMYEFSPLGFITLMSGKEGAGINEEFSKRNNIATDYTERRKRDLMWKATVGTMGMAAVYALTKLTYKDDDDEERPILIVTADGAGSYEANRKIAELSGKDKFEEYTVDFMGMRISYKYSPFAPWFLPVGYMMDAEKYGTYGNETEKEKIELYAKSLLGFMTFMKDQSSIQGLTDVLNIGNNADKYNKDLKIEDKFAESLKRSGSNALRSILLPNFIPQTYRQYKGVMDMPESRAVTFTDRLSKDIPFIDQFVEKRYDHFGQPINARWKVPGLYNEPTQDSPLYDLAREKRYIDNLKYFNLSKVTDYDGYEYTFSKEQTEQISREAATNFGKSMNLYYDNLKKMTQADFKTEANYIYKIALEDAIRKIYPNAGTFRLRASTDYDKPND